MKKIILLLITIILLSSGILYAQDGRPQYKIRNERAGVFIGDIIIELFPYVAPLHVANFDSLVSIAFYDSTAWHRVVPDFVIQGGDPNSINGPRDTWGYGDSTQATVPAEFSKVSHLTGIIGAARDEDINSATSQFYINTADNTGLDGNYTAYGVVVEGMEIVYDIESSQRDGNDNPLEKIEMFITKLGVNESVPGIPELIEPVDGRTAFTPDTLLVWTPVDNAILYFLEVASDSNFINIVYKDSVAASSDNILYEYNDVELGEKKFWWRVRANNGAKFGEYSETRNFTTSIAPPVLLSPADSTTNVVLNPLLQWEVAEGAVSYKLQMVRNFANFADARLLVNESGLTVTEWQLEGLDPDIRYYWRVSSQTPDYDSPYSKVSMFTTEEVSDVEETELPTKFSLSQNYPNPFNPTTTIKFSIPAETHGMTTLQVFDILGRELKTLVNKNFSPGNYEVNFNASNLPSGIYYYRLEAGDYSESRKMILLK